MVFIWLCIRFSNTIIRGVYFYANEIETLIEIANGHFKAGCIVYIGYVKAAQAEYEKAITFRHHIVRYRQQSLDSAWYVRGAAKFDLFQQGLHSFFILKCSLLAEHVIRV